MSKPRLLILLSGSGSNLQAFIDAQKAQRLDADIVAVISNKADAYGLERARQAGIEARCIEHKKFDSREAFDQALATEIHSFKADLIILAGFMRILTAGFVRQFKGRLLNIHPSLLPKYPGLNTHQRAIEAGDNFAGLSIHFVTEELDGGPIIAQNKVAINKDDTADELAARVLVQEHKVYPLVAQWFVSGRLQFKSGQVYLDQEPLNTPIMMSDLTD